MDEKTALTEALKYLMDMRPRDFEGGSMSKDYKGFTALKSKVVNGGTLGQVAVSRIMKKQGYKIKYVKDDN